MSLNACKKSACSGFYLHWILLNRAKWKMECALWIALRACIACFVCPPCLLRPSTTLVLSGQIACRKRTKCVCGAPKSLVWTSRKGKSTSQLWLLAVRKTIFSRKKAAFYSLSNVSILLFRIHTVDYVFLLPFFLASQPGGLNNGFSSIRKVRMSKCKGWVNVYCRHKDAFLIQASVSVNCESAKSDLHIICLRVNRCLEDKRITGRTDAAGERLGSADIPGW